MQQNVKTGLGVVLIVIILITIVFFLYNSPLFNEKGKIVNRKDVQSSKIDSVSKNIDSKETISYSNENFNFSFEYPNNLIKDWDVDYANPSESDMNPDTKINLSEAKEGDIIIDVKFSEGGHESPNADAGAGYSITVKKTFQTNIDNLVSNYKNDVEGITEYEGVKIQPPKIEKIENLVINGIDARKITINGLIYNDTLYFLIKDGYRYEISYDGLISSNNGKNKILTVTAGRESLDKIAQSFRFN